MKPQIETSDGILGGRWVKFPYKVSDGVDGSLSVDGLGFTKAAVQVYCSASSGGSGTAKIEQRNTSGGKSFPLLDPKTIEFTEGDVSFESDIEFNGRYLVLDLSDVTFGTEEGRVEIIVTLKL